jgi:hypothetical protein
MTSASAASAPASRGTARQGTYHQSRRWNGGGNAVLSGGGVPDADGMKRYREEQFAWWCRLMPFEDIETALEYVTTCEHGPAQVSIFSSNPDRIGTPIDSLVNQVNRPVRMRTEV